MFFFQVFSKYFSQPIKCVFHGSIEFNITLQALGKTFVLSFYSNEVIGKAKFGGEECFLGYILVQKKNLKKLIVFIIY